MKKFYAEFTGFIEVDTDEERDAHVLISRILEEINEVFALHGGIQDCGIDISKMKEKPLKKRYM
jgi:hypothetical protein